MSIISKTFKSGDVLKASELNTMVSAVNDNYSRVTTAEGEIETLDKNINGSFSAEISGKTVTLHNVVLNGIIGSTSGFSLTWNIFGGSKTGCYLKYSDNKLGLVGPQSFDFTTSPVMLDLNTKYETLVLTAPETSGVGDAVDVIYNGESIVKECDGLKAKVAQLAQEVSSLQANSGGVVDSSGSDKALATLCGQPPILFGAGTPQEAVVPMNWKQFDAETGEGYNWNGEPSAIGQQYINTSVSTGGRYVAVPDDNGGLTWKNF